MIAKIPAILTFKLLTYHDLSRHLDLEYVVIAVLNSKVKKASRYNRKGICSTKRTTYK
jgi:hypothetical protein